MAENMVTQEHDELTEALNDLFTNVSTMIKGDLQVSSTFSFMFLELVMLISEICFSRVQTMCSSCWKL